MLAITNTKNVSRDQFCVAMTGACWPNVPTFGCRDNMSPTRRQLSQPRVLTWFPWNCRIDVICCFDPMPSQIVTLWALHSVYNDKVCEISEVPKLLDRSLDYQYTLLGRTNLPRRFKQHNLCRAKLLDNFLDHSLLKLGLLDMAQRQLEVDMKVT